MTADILMAMNQLPVIETFSVSAYLSTLNEILTNIPAQIVGEVNECKISQDKFVWFKLKDPDQPAVLDCFLMKFALPFPIQDGDQVTVGGFPKVYAKSGKLSFQVQSLTLSGEGSLKKAFEALKAKLTLEGLFAPEHKQALPRFPQTVGIIASKEGAVIHDMLRTLNERWGGLRIFHYPAAAQGQRAIEELVAGITYFNQQQPVDVLLVARGGGSAEDLQAFNAEPLCRAIFASRISIVSGVGHEPDITLCDLVADVRAATPTAAAKLVVPDRLEIGRQVGQLVATVVRTVEQQLTNWQLTLDRSTLHLVATAERLASKSHELFHRLSRETVSLLRQLTDRLGGLERSLLNLNPLTVLERGYSITTLSSGELLVDSAAASIGVELHSRLHNGVVKSKVI